MAILGLIPATLKRQAFNLRRIVEASRVSTACGNREASIQRSRSEAGSNFDVAIAFRSRLLHLDVRLSEQRRQYVEYYLLSDLEMTTCNDLKIPATTLAVGPSSNAAIKIPLNFFSYPN